MPTIESIIEQKRAQLAQLEDDIAALERAQSLMNASTSKRGRKKGTGRRGRPPGKASAKTVTQKSTKKAVKASAKSKKQSAKAAKKSTGPAPAQTNSQ